MIGTAHAFILHTHTYRACSVTLGGFCPIGSFLWSLMIVGVVSAVGVAFRWLKRRQGVTLAK